MKPIPTRVHGILDYAMVGTLLILPRILGWNNNLTMFFTAAAVVVLIYTLLTRFELGVAKMIPVSVHLILDALMGLGLLVAPFLMSAGDTGAMVIPIALGLFELVTAFLTQTQPDYAGQTSGAGMTDR